MKLLFKVFTLLFGALGGIAAGALFKQLWKMVAHEDEAPKATDAERGWAEVLTAAALQGAVFAGVRAVVDRSGANGVEWLTGKRPA